MVRSYYLLKIVLLTLILNQKWCFGTFNLKDLTLEWENKVKDDAPHLFPDNVDPQETQDIFESDQNDPNKYLNSVELITKVGFKVEEHFVITEDKYNLTMYRIPKQGNCGNISSDGPPVLLGHGLFSSSDDFVTPGIKNGIAFLLAFECYDVWIVNFRGNKYSRRHLVLSPDHDASYWSFTFHQMGQYDLPATIDYILNNTKQSSLKYICHSLGCTCFFVMGSERPEYSKKISIVVGLSVVAWMYHTISPAMWLFSIESLYRAAELLGIHEFADENPINAFLREVLCGTKLQSNVICSTIVFLIGGFDYSQINATTFSNQIAHVPSGVSLMNMEHVGQHVKNPAFRQYDYGITGNLKNYGSASPPDYNLGNIHTPIAILRGLGDWLSRKEDLDILTENLPNVVENFKVPYNDFCHFDFIWAKDLYRLIYPKISELLNKY